MYNSIYKYRLILCNHSRLQYPMWIRSHYIGRSPDDCLRRLTASSIKRSPDGLFNKLSHTYIERSPNDCNNRHAIAIIEDLFIVIPKDLFIPLSGDLQMNPFKHLQVHSSKGLLMVSSRYLLLYPLEDLSMVSSIDLFKHLLDDILTDVLWHSLMTHQKISIWLLLQVSKWLF